MGARGTPHLHFYFHFSTSIRKSTLKNKFPRAHLFKCKGTPDDNIKYVTKGEGKKINGEWVNHGLNYIGEERGIKPTQAQRIAGMLRYLDIILSQVHFFDDCDIQHLHDECVTSILDVNECAKRLIIQLKDLLWTYDDANMGYAITEVFDDKETSKEIKELLI